MKILTTLSLCLVAATCAVFNFATANSAPIEKQLALEQITLHYTEAGTGDTIVAVHGAVSDIRVWDAYHQPLSRQHRFVS